MASERTDEEKFSTIIIGALSVTVILLLIAPMIFVIGKDIAYSAYEFPEEETEQLAQITDMRKDMVDQENYYVANTMSTPMLVNDWKDPHRTMLLIIAPEKNIDATEAEEIHKFVTEKGGKVIVAADNNNANLLAKRFNVQYFDSYLLDENQHWLEYDDDGAVKRDSNDGEIVSWRNVWTVASIGQDVENMAPGALRQGCSDFNLDIHNTVDCRLPVMLRSPTGLLYTPSEKDISDPGHRNVMVLATASTSAFIDIQKNGDAGDPLNPAPGNLNHIIRFDYPNITVLDQVSSGSGGGTFSGGVGDLSVTGSITFVTDQNAFGNRLWTLDEARKTGLRESCIVKNCWTEEITTNNDWLGNQKYFKALMYDMMEFDNLDLSAQIKNGDFAGDKSNFNVVFDESRHATGVIASPFVETMGTIVLLTSNTFLKWLVVLNVGLLLLVAMMVVPQKENWRHVFDLTRFSERPDKLDPKTYRTRVQQSLFTKIRVHHDLTRDEMATKPPAEVQSMIGDPRLVELAYSQSRTYTPKELRQMMQAIRRWGKNN
ncbi:MAG: hypothetical protein ACKVI6_01320 [Candidatus Poseidoniales archaeon]